MGAPHCASYRLRSGRRRSVTGPLALLAGQALEAATSGREVQITDSDGRTVSVTNTDHGISVAPVGPIELFPTDPTNHQTPAWATRLAGLITNLQGEMQ